VRKRFGSRTASKANSAALLMKAAALAAMTLGTIT
jgi:hypothetical protein